MTRTSRVHEPRSCLRCRAALPDGSARNRQFCPSCGAARRALTYLVQADRALEGANARVAREHVNAAMGALESPL